MQGLGQDDAELRTMDVNRDNGWMTAEIKVDCVDELVQGLTKDEVWRLCKGGDQASNCVLFKVGFFLEHH